MLPVVRRKLKVESTYTCPGSPDVTFNTCFMLHEKNLKTKTDVNGAYKAIDINHFELEFSILQRQTILYVGCNIDHSKQNIIGGIWMT